MQYWEREENSVTTESPIVSRSEKRTVCGEMDEGVTQWDHVPQNALSSGQLNSQERSLMMCNRMSQDEGLEEGEQLSQSLLNTQVC